MSDANNRCPRCDRAVATSEDWRMMASGDDPYDVCWDSATCPPVDWRARALSAEAAFSEIAAVRADLRAALDIIAGNPVPPTNNQIDRHDGAWLIADGADAQTKPELRIVWLWMVEHNGTPEGTDRGVMPPTMLRCWPLADDGTPIAMPTEDA